MYYTRRIDIPKTPFIHPTVGKEYEVEENVSDKEIKKAYKEIRGKLLNTEEPIIITCYSDEYFDTYKKLVDKLSGFIRPQNNEGASYQDTHHNWCVFFPIPMLDRLNSDLHVAIAKIYINKFKSTLEEKECLKLSI